MSDFKPLLMARFYDRRNQTVLDEMPVLNSINLNLDLRQLSDAFDFELLLNIDDEIDLRSHDFVEYFFKDENGHEFQVACGYLGRVVSDTSPNQLRYQANGTDFLGQLFKLPFLEAHPFDNTTLVAFVNYCLKGSYLTQYLAMKSVSASRYVIARSPYAGNIAVQELTDAKIAPVMQATADGVYNTIYQSRNGQAVIYGRGSRLDFDTGLELTEFGDSNVEKMNVVRDYTNVVSAAKVLYVGAQANVNYAVQSGAEVFNSDPDAANIFQPEIRTFTIPDLINTPGDNELGNKMTLLAQSIVRKSNQFLRQVIVSTNKPFHLQADGTRTWYEKGLVFYITNDTHKIVKEEMMLVGIQYSQDESRLGLQLAFIPVDTLV